MKISSDHHWVRVSRLGSVWDSVLGLVLFVCDFGRFRSIGDEVLKSVRADSVLFVVQFGTKLAFCLG